MRMLVRDQSMHKVGRLSAAQQVTSCQYLARPDCETEQARGPKGTQLIWPEWGMVLPLGKGSPLEQERRVMSTLEDRYWILRVLMMKPKGISCHRLILYRKYCVRAEVESKGHGQRSRYPFRLDPREQTEKAAPVSLRDKNHTIRRWQYGIDSGAGAFLTCIDEDRVLDIFWIVVPRITFLYASGDRAYLSYRTPLLVV